jgi:HD-GYP domain-containing protein (c-di-GMP phosphodiesterase class II)
MDNKQAQEVFAAGLLHAIGKVGFDDELLGTPVNTMTARQREAYHQHPVHAEHLLMPLSELKATAEIIGAQLERFDGSGYPKGTAGRHIPLGARILAVVGDFASLQVGILEPQQLSVAAAQAVLVQQRGHDYDPAVVDAFIAMFRRPPKDELTLPTPRIKSISSSEFEPGMVLARDLLSPSGMLLLTAGHVLDAAVISKISSFERSIHVKLSAVIQQDSIPIVEVRDNPEEPPL